MVEEKIQDEELLYRRISAGRGLYAFGEEGTIEISSAAFSDREFRISMDRAKLCGNDPGYTLRGEKGGVVGLFVGEIRNIEGLARNDQKGRAIQQFSIDVKPAPLENNPAHAEIYALLPFTHADRKAAFRRLCQRLAYLAEARGWEIVPDCQ